MRKLKSIIIIAILASFTFISCNTKSKSNSINEKTENFDWLLGIWERTNEEEGKETFENWKKISNTEYAGVGFTMQNGKVKKSEKIKLIKQKGKWDLIVEVDEANEVYDKEPVTFKMTELSSSSFTCENDSIDFPKMIKYWKDGEKIKALVAGKDLEIPFEFVKADRKF